MQQQVHALAVAFATANSHPDPHAYADTVIAHLENPVPRPEAPIEPEPAADTATDTAIVTETGADSSAPAVP